MYASRVYWDYDEGKYVVRVHSQTDTKNHYFVNRGKAEKFRKTIPFRLETLNTKLHEHA